jgi:hypothetical protein
MFYSIVPEPSVVEVVEEKPAEVAAPPVIVEAVQPVEVVVQPVEVVVQPILEVVAEPKVDYHKEETQIKIEVERNLHPQI